jgi:chromate transport protein ChrA
MELVWIGSGLGAVVGVLHGAYLYRQVARAKTLRARARGIYFALWAFALWAAFGTYVLVLWAVGVVLYALAGLKARLFASTRAPLPRSAGAYR